jgi:protein tyrosine phosphatase (PTP) superfamily phosphohydrolase (DUF442 family)
MILVLTLASLFLSETRAQSPTASQQWQKAQNDAAKTARQAQTDNDAEEPDEALGDAPLSDEPLLVSSGLYRSPRPKPNSYARLKALGIKTILNLQSRGAASDERRLAAPFKIDVVNVPMSGLAQPSFAQLDSALRVLTTAPRPILVHCLHGQDRTGVVVAAYRVVVEGKSPSDAVREASSLHCCHLVSSDLTGLLTRYRAYRLGP